MPRQHEKETPNAAVEAQGIGADKNESDVQQENGKDNHLRSQTDYP